MRKRSARGPAGHVSRVLQGLVFVCGAGAVLAGCGPTEYDPALLRQAAAFGEDQRWDEARPLIKAHLLQYPEDAIAHYYFGLSYLHLQHPQLTLAEGELLIAQALLDQDEAPTEDVAGMEFFTFKGVLHQKTALVYMRAFREALRMEVPYEYARSLLLKAVAQVDLGLKSDPKSHALKEYRDFLQETLQGMPESVPEIVTRAAGKGSSI